jgi:hypothetical protein
MVIDQPQKNVFSRLRPLERKLEDATESFAPSVLVGIKAFADEQDPAFFFVGIRDPHIN